MRDTLRLLWPGGQLVAIVVACLATLATQSRSPITALEQSYVDQEEAESVAAMVRAQRDNFGVGERERLVRVEVILERIQTELVEIKTHLSQHRDWILYLLAALVGFTPAKDLFTGIKRQVKNGRVGP